MINDVKEKLESGDYKLLSAEHIGSSSSAEIWREYALLKNKDEVFGDFVLCRKCLQKVTIRDNSGILLLFICIFIIH